MILFYIFLYFVGMILLSVGLAWWFAMNAESSDDPDTCRDKALEFAGDAYRQREAE